VLTLLCLLSGILYLDRICISQAVTPMERELGLSGTQISAIMMAFTLAYAIFEIPTGHWGDRRGGRAVLVRISLWWSLFTGLTGACTGVVSLLVVRFLFGAGEAGAYPNTARVLARWFPDSERARAQGLLLASAQIGSWAATPVAGYVIEYLGWRWMFPCFGAVGVLWAAFFWWWFRDDPAEHPNVNSAELKRIGSGRAGIVLRHEGIPWAAVSRNYSVWVLAAIMICGAFNQYFYYSWFPAYLRDARGIANVKTGWLASIPFVGTALGTFLGGFIAELTVRRAANRDRVFCTIGGVAYALGSGCLWYAVGRDDVNTFVLFAALSCLCLALTLPLWWSCAIHISGRHVGALFGLMNMLGGIGALSSQYLVGGFKDWRKSLGYEGRLQWDPVFNVYVTMLIVGSVCWFLYRSHVVEAADLRDAGPDHTPA
jgi:MFS family permease